LAHPSQTPSPSPGAPQVSFVKPTVIRILKAVFTVLCIAHFLACAWYLVIASEGPDASAAFSAHAAAAAAADKGGGRGGGVGGLG